MKISVIFPIFHKIRLIAGLLAEFLGIIQAIFIRHNSRAKVSVCSYHARFIFNSMWEINP